MRTSLTELQQIDGYASGTAPTGDKLVFEAKLILDPALQQKLSWHKQTIRLVQHYGRRDLRAVISGVHEQLFTASQHRSFSKKVLSFFNK